MKTRKHKGFSMVEIIIIIAIMAILSAALAPMLIKYVRKSRRVRDIDAAGQIQSAFDRVSVEMSDDHLMADGTYGSGLVTLRYDVNTLNDPPQYIEDRAFAELGGIPKVSTDASLYWKIEYTTFSGHVTKIWLTDGTNDYELLPDGSNFEENGI